MRPSQLLVRLVATVVTLVVVGACSDDEAPLAEVGATAESVASSTEVSAKATTPPISTTAPLTGTNQTTGGGPSPTPLSLGPGGIGDGECPTGEGTTLAVVTGVEEWVRMRSGPSLEADEVGRLDVRAEVTAYPNSLTYDGSSYWWVTIAQPDTTSCVSVAASFLSDAKGTLERRLPGIEYTLPTTGTWVPSHTASYLDAYTWALDGAFLAEVAIDVEEATNIDERLAEQLAAYESDGYDVPEQWFEEVSIPGADRAVELTWISGSGDVGWGEVWVEVGPYALIVSRAVYIEDFETAPTDEMDRFLTSVKVDRVAFFAGMSA